MKILLIGGTGNISSGIVKALEGRAADKPQITVFNRGKSDDRLPANVTRLHGDRYDFPAFEKQFAGTTWDAVIDMICFTPEQAESLVRTFAGKTPQLVFCSTVCTYGNTQTIIPTGEGVTPRPRSSYGKNKALCEEILLRAGRDGAFGGGGGGGGGVTIFRPSHTFGPGGNLHGQTGSAASPGFLDRLKKNLPVIVSGDGHGLWQLAYSEDVGRGFAYAVGRPQTYNEIYNIVSERVLTWDEVTQKIAAALGYPAPRIVHIPTDFLVAIDPGRYGVVDEIFRYHGVYSNAKIHRDIPEYQEKASFDDAVRTTVRWMEAHGRTPDAQADPFESRLIELYESFAASAKKSLVPKALG